MMAVCFAGEKSEYKDIQERMKVLDRQMCAFTG